MTDQVTISREALKRVLQTLKFYEGGFEYSDSMFQVEKALAAPAQDAKPVVPDGYVLVPVEPTDAMMEVGRDSLGRGHGMFLIYESMIKAAPKQ
jgi:hypothetical protein